MAAARSFAVASGGGIGWIRSKPAEPPPMKRATYEDVLKAPENDVAQILKSPSGAFDSHPLPPLYK
jgi:hypothetical protein